MPDMLVVLDEGYVYAIIGQVWPEEFYRRTVEATVIQGSEAAARRFLLPCAR